MEYEKLKDVWLQVLKIIEKVVAANVIYTTWIEPLEPLKEQNGVIFLRTYDQFSKNMIEQRYLRLIQNSFKEITAADYEIKIVIPDDVNHDIKTHTLNEKNDLSLSSNLNPRYTFDTFIVGNSNRMAHAASLAVAESPAKAYNPLFLYGGVGLGKTHLMHSIAHFILSQNPKTKVVYASSEKFTNELINSIKDDKNEDFRNRYRTIDVLLIDDIQFISEKERTQEEFFHTFNTLHEANKQIIISSDRPPKEIKPLEDRLRSRFEWGLIADIQPPDFETRVAILRKKADTDNIKVPNDVVAFIAKSIVSNIRELEGALTRLVAYSTLVNADIHIDLAHELLKDIFSEAAKQITPEYVQEITAHHFGLKPEDLRSRKRTQNISHPRQIAMYLCRKLMDISLPKLGDKFGGKDHTTILHGCDKIAAKLETDPELQKTIAELEKKIAGR